MKKGQLLSLFSALLFTACGGGNNISPDGNEKAKYKVDIDYTEFYPLGDDDAEMNLSDKGSYIVTFTGNTGTISDIENSNLISTGSKAGANCTITLVDGGPGRIQIRPETLELAERDKQGNASIHFKLRQETTNPVIKISCPPVDPITTLPKPVSCYEGSVDFITDGTVQVFNGSQVNTPIISGGKFKVTVSPVN